MAATRRRRTGTCGVYRITCTANGKVYVGSSTNLESRLLGHKNGLRRKKSPNRKLQRAWDKHGESTFVFDVLETIDVTNLTVPEKAKLIEKVEQKWIDDLQAFGPRGFNLRPKSHSNIGFSQTDESKSKISAKNKGLKRSDEFREEVTRRNLGRKATDETKARMSVAHSNRVYPPMSEETKAKLSAAHKNSETARKRWAAIAEARRGTHPSNETRAKMSASQKGRKQSAETIAKRVSGAQATKLAKRIASEQYPLFPPFPEEE